jgi:pseudouridine kinase
MHIKLGNNKLEQEESILGNIYIFPGGVGRNIASALSALKITASFISIFSEDIFSQIILKSINKKYIDFSQSIFNSEKTSIYCDIITAESHYGINDMKNVDLFTIPFFEKKMNFLDSMDLIVIDLNMREEILQYLVDTSTSKLICDATSIIKCSKLKNYLKNIYILKANYYEALELVGCKNDLKIEGLMDLLLLTGVKKVYITLGDQGAVFADLKGKIHIKRKETLNTQNTSGAGDAFLAAILYGKCNCWNIIKSLSFAVNLAYYYILEGKYMINDNILQQALNFDQKDMLYYFWNEKNKEWEVGNNIYDN